LQNAGFLGDLLVQAISEGRPDAVVVLSPVVTFSGHVSDELVQNLAQPACPLIYLSYNPHPFENLWHDSMAEAVKRFNGEEHMISRPQDLLHLWPEISSHLSQVAVAQRARRVN
jgi:hypothetical protein